MPASTVDVVDLLKEFAGDVAQLAADARLGRRVRQKNRDAARARRGPRADEPEFAAAVIRLRRQGVTFGAIAIRLEPQFGEPDNVDPRMALAKRASRAWQRYRDAQPRSCPEPTGL